MIDLGELQKKVYQNKINKGFNVKDVALEFNYITVELSEAIEAYHKKLPNVGEELADIVIYLLGLSEILDIDLEKEILDKIEKNKKREYKKINGIVTRTKDA